MAKRSFIIQKPDPPEQQKANTLIAVAIVCVGASISVAVGGGVTGPVAARGVVVAPAQMAGAWLGTWLFNVLPGDFFKKFSLIILIILGLMVAIFQTDSANSDSVSTVWAVPCSLKK